MAVRRVALALRDVLQSPPGDVLQSPPGDVLQSPPREAQLRDLGRIITSPFARAFETAEIMASILAPHLELDIDEDLTPDGSAFDLAVRLASYEHDTLLVGHQPNIEMVARALAVPAPRPSGLGSARHPAMATEHRPAMAPGSSSPIGVRMPIGFRTGTLVGFQVRGRPPPYVLALALDPTELPSP